MAKGKRKKGRPGTEVYDGKGKLVEGLSYRKDRYYYPTGRRDIKLGTERLAAIAAFRVWQARERNERVQIVDPTPKITAKSSLLHPELKTYTITAPQIHDISKDQIMALFQEWLSDPVKCQMVEECTGWPTTRLLLLPARGKPITLEEALANYNGKKKRISENEKRQVQYAWDSFADSTKARTLQQVTAEAVSKWLDKLLDHYAPKMVNNRVARVKTVLRYNAKMKKDAFNCNRILDDIRVHDLPDNPTAKPQPITRKQFEALLAGADKLKGGYDFTVKDETRHVQADYWRAMLLVSLNCAFYAVDVTRLPVSAIDLEAGTLTWIREKENTPRIAVLWPQTVEALRPYVEGRQDRTYVFETYRKEQWSTGGLLNAFVILRHAAGLPTLEFNSIRDGAYTQACKISSDQGKLISGHSLGGETDSYVLRNPEMVADACAAIEAHYFPTPQEQQIDQEAPKPQKDRQKKETGHGQRRDCSKHAPKGKVRGQERHRGRSASKSVSALVGKTQ